MSSENAPTTAHEVMKRAYTHGTKLYRVTIHEKSGPSVIKIDRLSSGQTFTFNRASKNDSHTPTTTEDTTSTILHLTQSEVYNLRNSHFTVEEVDAADVESVDPFSDPLADSTDVSEDDWTLVQTPVEYLDKTPDGPKAELATKMIEAGFPNASSRK